MDGVKGELEKEKTVSASLKSKLEAAALKVRTIAVDSVLSARVELIGEFKRGEYISWDLDEEIWTWEKRIAVLAGDGDYSEEEGDEELAPAVVSLKHVEPDTGAMDAAADIGE